MSDRNSSRQAGRTAPAYRALRHRDYRLLWGAELASTTGTQMQRVAIAWQVFQLTGDPLQLGLLGLFRFAPMVLFGLVGGVIADRSDRRRTLLVTQLALLGTSAALAALTAADAVTMPIIYALTFVSATVAAMGGPARQALIPSLVPAAQIPAAMSLNVLAFQVAAVSGPLLGGVTIDRFGVAATYGIDAASFLVVAVAVFAIRTRPPVQTASTSGLAAALEGLRFLRGSPILLGVMVVDLLANFFGASMTLLPVFAEEVLGVGADGLGVLYAAPAAGAVAASLVMSTAPAFDRPGAGVLLSVGIYGGCLLGFGLRGTLWLSLLFLAGSGAAEAVSMALRHAVRNLTTPDPLRGRVAAAHSVFAGGGPQLGEFEAGVIASAIGVGPSVALGGLGAIGSAVAVWLWVPTIARFRLGEAVAEPRSPRAATPGGD